MCAVVGALPSLTPKFPADSLFYLLVIETLPPRCVQAVIEFAGGWNISGAPDSGIDFQEKIFRCRYAVQKQSDRNILDGRLVIKPVCRLQNQLGVSALFTWGIISENNSNHIAIVPGGWNEDYLQDAETYVKVNSLVTLIS